MTLLALLARIFATVGFLWWATRISGKREWLPVRPLDLMLAFVLGQAGSNLVLGRMGLPEGLMALGTLVWLHLLLTTVLRRSERLRTWLWGRPITLVEHGKILSMKQLHRQMTDDEVMALLYSAGLARLQEVQLLRMESDGTLTLIPRTSEHPVTHRDLQQHAREDQPWQRAA